MKKTLTALLTLLLALTMLCPLAQADVYRCRYLMVSDDEDTPGDETAEIEAIYKDSVLVLDTDENSIVISSGTTTITEEKIIGTEEDDENEQLYFMTTDAGNIYAITCVEGHILIFTIVGQTLVTFDMN